MQRLPLHLARAGRNTLAGDVVGNRQIGGRGDGPSARVPDLGFAGEVVIGHAIRERPADRADQQVFLVGRGIDLVISAAGPIRSILPVSVSMRRAGRWRSARTGPRRAGWRACLETWPSGSDGPSSPGRWGRAEPWGPPAAGRGSPAPARPGDGGYPPARRRY